MEKYKEIDNSFIEEAIKKAIDEKIDVDVILDREDKMLR